jgi:hypothetical protein
MLDVITSLMAPLLVASFGMSAPQDTARAFEFTATTVGLGDSQRWRDGRPVEQRVR